MPTVRADSRMPDKNRSRVLAVGALDFLIPKDPSADTRDVRSRFLSRSLRFVRSFLVLSYFRKRVYILLL